MAPVTSDLAGKRGRYFLVAVTFGWLKKKCALRFFSLFRQSESLTQYKFRLCILLTNYTHKNKVDYILNK